MPDCISVEEIGKAREERSGKIKSILSSDQNILAILFTLNIPGRIKDTPLYRKMHKAGTSEIIKSLKWNKISFSIIKTAHLSTGSEGYFAIHCSSGSGGRDCPDPVTVKKIAAAVEETHPLGRFFDIDIFEKPHNKVSSGRPLRKCFLCGNDAFVCSRSASHPVEKLVEKIREKGEEWYREHISWKIAETACKALLSEAACAPKPGLVDLTGSGSHADMDFYTFIKSSASLYRTFFKIAQTGYDYSDRPLPEMLPALQIIGIEGEKEMYEATEGVNTHKGLIYSMGLLSAAAGYLCAKHKEKITAEKICSSAGVIIAVHTADYLAELEKKGEGINPTAGEKLFIRHGITGARGEAAGGFKSALKAFRRLEADLSDGRDFNLSLLDTLMHIMEEAQDTNIPGRKDISYLNFINREAEKFNKEGGVFSENGFDGPAALKKLDRLFIEKNLSPGGCADILALSIFLYYIEHDLDPVIFSDY